MWPAPRLCAAHQVAAYPGGSPVCNRRALTPVPLHHTFWPPYFERKHGAGLSSQVPACPRCGSRSYSAPPSPTPIWEAWARSLRGGGLLHNPLQTRGDRLSLRSVGRRAPHAARGMRGPGVGVGDPAGQLRGDGFRIAQVGVAHVISTLKDGPSGLGGAVWRHGLSFLPGSACRQTVFAHAAVFRRSPDPALGLGGPRRRGGIALGRGRPPWRP